MEALSRYRKTIAAVVAAGIGWATAVVTSAPEAITASEWIMGASALAAAFGVWVVPNDPPHGVADPDVSERG